MEAAPTKRSYIRLAAVRALLLGTARATVCQLYCRTDRMIRLWIEMFNRGGADALLSKARTGRPRRISLQKLGDLLVPVLKDPALAGQRHWTGVKVHGWLKEQLQAEVSYRTAIRYLHELEFNRRIPRRWPAPPEHKEAEREAARETFQKSMDQWLADPNVKLWFCDECGVEGDPRPRHRWVQPGSKPTIPYRGKHIRQSVLGAVSPADGQFSALIFDGVNTAVFQCFLDELAVDAPAQEGVRQLLIMDNASWHRSASLRWHHFQPVYLPSYSPDFNPIERLWLRLKCEWFTDWIAKSTEVLIEHLSRALRSFFEDPAKTASCTAIRK